MRTILASLATTIMLGATSSAAWAAPAPASECKLSVIGELPILMDGLRPLLAMKIAGEDVFFVVDTGAHTTFIARELVDRLQLRTVPLDGVRAFGIGGEIEQVVAVDLPEITIGRFPSRNVRLMVAPSGKFAGGREAGLIGQDFLGAYDVEFDLANGMIRLMKAEHCDKVPLAYWAPQHAQAEIVQEGGRGGHLTTIAEINGQRVRALLDTGASRSILDLDAAQRAGITPESPGAAPDEMAQGLGKAEFAMRLVRVQSFGVGEEKVTNTRLRIGDLDVNAAMEANTGSRLRTQVADFPDMLIGADFFLAHRIYISGARRRMYFTHNGRGGVFAQPSAGMGGAP